MRHENSCLDMRTTEMKIFVATISTNHNLCSFWVDEVYHVVSTISGRFIHAWTPLLKYGDHSIGKST